VSDDEQPQIPVTPRGSGRRRLLVIAGLVVLVAIGAVIAWQLDRNDVGRTTGAEAAEEFLVASVRGIDATYRLDGEFTRTRSDGAEIGSGLLVVQRPPDRLQRSLGSTTGVVAGRSVNCGVQTDGGRYDCAPGAEVAPWEQRREEQIEALRQFVSGDDPVYAVVVKGNGCFELLQRRFDVEATYGARAELCFDGATGALRRLEVVREGGTTDVLEGTVINAQVTDGDFDLSADDTYDPLGPDGG
jgi:hypothetical protein